jgi:hypothetical protein
MVDRSRIAREFAEAVNMSAAELRDWLTTQQSLGVGSKPGGPDSESIGHASGRRIAAILDTARSDLGDDDYRHMRKVVSFIRRHSAQEPANPVTSRWRYSLMNWGYDPLKTG